ncbi:hypothetical protein TNCV_1487831 [Trichonephila clavipes]|nr:hypothetical protein TNCV_1487831 [Trichonephila clavipes]
MDLISAPPAIVSKSQWIWDKDEEPCVQIRCACQSEMIGDLKEARLEVLKGDCGAAAPQEPRESNYDGLLMTE